MLSESALILFSYGLLEFKSTLENKYASVFNRIALKIIMGIAPSVKDIHLVPKYFNKEATTTIKAISRSAVPTINLNILRQILE